jgi:hypothetical protein
LRKSRNFREGKAAGPKRRTFAFVNNRLEGQCDFDNRCHAGAVGRLERACRDDDVEAMRGRRRSKFILDNFVADLTMPSNRQS